MYCCSMHVQIQIETRTHITEYRLEMHFHFANHPERLVDASSEPYASSAAHFLRLIATRSRTRPMIFYPCNHRGPQFGSRRLDLLNGCC